MRDVGLRYKIWLRTEAVARHAWAGRAVPACTFGDPTRRQPSAVTLACSRLGGPILCQRGIRYMRTPSGTFGAQNLARDVVSRTDEVGVLSSNSELRMNLAGSCSQVVCWWVSRCKGLGRLLAKSCLRRTTPTTVSTSTSATETTWAKRRRQRAKMDPSH